MAKAAEAESCGASSTDALDITSTTVSSWPIRVRHDRELSMAKRKDREDHNAADTDSDADSQSAQSSQGAAAQHDSDRLIKALNALPTCRFQDQYISPDELTYPLAPNRSVTIDFKASADLSKEELASSFALIATTSRADYEPSSFGWHPQRKRREMLEPEMRYLLVRGTTTTTTTTADRDAGDGARQAAESVAGFLSFMLTHDSVPSAPVLYIYEIHLEARLRGSGMGAHLMRVAENIARRVALEKVMLTCFLSNENALGFYRRRGYERDECSPEDRRTRRKVVRVDYVILSKRVGGEASGSGNGMLSAIRDWTSKLAGEQVRDGKAVAQMRGWA